VGYDLDVKGYRVHDRNGKYHLSRDVIFDENESYVAPFVAAGDISVWMSDGPTKVLPDHPIPFLPPENAKRVSIHTSRGKAWDEGIIACDNHMTNIRNRRKLPVTPEIALISHVTDLENAQAVNNVPVFEEVVEEHNIVCESVFLISHPLPRDLHSSAFPSRFDLSKIPEKYSDALVRPDYPDWRKAMEAEVKGLQDMGVYRVVEALPKGKVVIGTRWVFDYKYDLHGNIMAHKVRLVAQGYRQRPEDYGMAYAPTACMMSVRILLALAASLNLEIFT